MRGRLGSRLGIMMSALLASMACAPQASSQDASTLKKDMIGQWELSTTERSKTCVVTLKNDATPQGLKLELEPSCAAALPFTKAITAWNIRGLDIVRLQDSTGESVIDFTEVESGIFEGLRQGEGIYILQNLAAARSLAKSMRRTAALRGACQDRIRCSSSSLIAFETPSQQTRIVSRRRSARRPMATRTVSARPIA